ncbi:phosphoglycerate mutase-like protein at74h [Phtheirospermum japonicum]|uniref:Phosphoglycerate mutase-like protein at74h n=1 Tax=Phtheirospermum japonicum TaxID=374723 RepID=A0A830BS26_9LAMI|nr:phosphoglycerate mutase-like protein at74h [Phtheirospermum japonicum]
MENNNTSNNLSKYRNSSFYVDQLSAINQQTQKHLPKRIILVRHGESQGNEDETVLEYVPDYKIKLSKKGGHQARTTGSTIRDIVSGKSENWKVVFYVSPSSRTRETVEEIVGSTFPKDRVVGVREECRLREQHFGNFQEVEERRKIKRTRNRYGKFFYRVPGGESSADVYDRVSTFIEGLWRDMETNKFNINSSSSDDNELNLIVVSHGLTILLFLMKWFNWTVDQFEALTNPRNCEYRVLELGLNGEYSLAIHHQLEELKEWGLSEEMIEDQKIRASKIF